MADRNFDRTALSLVVIIILVISFALCGKSFPIELAFSADGYWDVKDDDEGRSRMSEYLL
jgi:predicted small lipoprotein YifL